MAFADFGESPVPVAGTSLVHLPDDAPMRREWVVVCDAPDYPAMLTAWELPGSSVGRDGFPRSARRIRCWWPPRRDPHFGHPLRPRLPGPWAHPGRDAPLTQLRASMRESPAGV